MLDQIGGGVGHICIAMAKHHPNVTYLIEDLPGLEEQANENIRDEDLSDQVKFLVHDMFEPQPPEARGVSAYILGHILHDWPDALCRKIIKNIVDAMKPDSKIIIGEVCIDPNFNELQEAMVRTVDMNMLMLANGSQRTVEGWEQLCQSVDARLYVSKVIGPPKLRRHLVEVSLGQ